MKKILRIFILDVLITLTLFSQVNDELIEFAIYEINNNNHLKSIDILTTVINSDSTNFKAYYHRATAYEYLYQTQLIEKYKDSLISDYKVAFHLNPYNDYIVKKLHKYIAFDTSAYKFYEISINNFPNDYKLYDLFGEYLLLTRNFLKANQIYEKIIQFDKDANRINYYPYKIKAFCLLSLKDTLNALKNFEIAYTLDTNQIDLIETMKDLYYDFNNYGLALIKNKQFLAKFSLYEKKELLNLSKEEILFKKIIAEFNDFKINLKMSNYMVATDLLKKIQKEYSQKTDLIYRRLKKQIDSNLKLNKDDLLLAELLNSIKPNNFSYSILLINAYLNNSDTLSAKHTIWSLINQQQDNVSYYYLSHQLFIEITKENEYFISLMNNNIKKKIFPEVSYFFLIGTKIMLKYPKDDILKDIQSLNSMLKKEIVVYDELKLNFDLIDKLIDLVRDIK